MKQIIFSVLFFLIYTTVFSQNIPYYDCQEITTLKIGNNEGEVGYNRAFGEGGGYPGPTYYSFSPEGDFYICDYINKRINVYNSSFDFIRTINPDKKIGAGIVLRMKFDSKENLTLILDMKGLYKIDGTGQMLYEIPQDSLPKDVYKKYDFFNIGEELLYYDTGKNDLKIKILNNSGENIENQKVISFLNENNLDLTKSLDIQEEDIDTLQTFIKNKPLVIKDNKILSTDFNQHRGYYEALKKMKANEEAVLDDKNDAIFKKISGATLKGFDKYGNSFWFCSDELDYRKYFIVILSNKGKLIDYFTTDLIKEAFLSVSPEGDIYFIKVNEEACKIYETIRNW